ncbi:MAG: hypothetical protein K0Q43_1861 [Ramlibacter sp.]|jgi:hypothetical protein|nr:hypothetical protein [Ramlibacter sp.]
MTGTHGVLVDNPWGFIAHFGPLVIEEFCELAAQSDAGMLVALQFAQRQHRLQMVEAQQPDCVNQGSCLLA